MSVPGGICILSGTAHPQLAAGIAKLLNIPLAACKVGRFSNGEISVSIQENIREKDVYIIQPTCNPNPNDNLMELLILTDATRRASAKRVTAVVPLFGYARQDKKDRSRAPITAKLVANLLETAGIDRIITLDLHAQQIQGFFDIPCDNLYSEALMIKHIHKHLRPRGDLVIVSPDEGGVKRAKLVADQLEGVDIAIIHKERKIANQVASMTLVGRVAGKVAIVVDDMADTCGTLVLAAETLLAEGATEVHAMVSHGVLSGDAVRRINDSQISSLVVTDSIPQVDRLAQCPKMKMVSIAPMFAEAIRRTHHGESISSLFDTKHLYSLKPQN